MRTEARLIRRFNHLIGVIYGAGERGGECAIAHRMLGQSGSGGGCGAEQRDDLGLALLAHLAGPTDAHSLKAPVVLPQDGYHFWPTEFGRDLLALRQHLALARA